MVLRNGGHKRHIQACTGSGCKDVLENDLVKRENKDLQGNGS
jgi:hypothetical protein